MIIIETSVRSKDNEIEKVEFHIDNTLRSTDIADPHCWTLSNPTFFKHSVKEAVYNTTVYKSTKEFTMWKFF